MEDMVLNYSLSWSHFIIMQGSQKLFEHIINLYETLDSDWSIVPPPQKKQNNNNTFAT